MTKPQFSALLAVVLCALGLLPLAWAVETRLGPRGVDSSMAWGVVDAMFVAPLWLVVAIAGWVVDLRRPRTRAASIASLAFPIGFALGMIVVG